MGRLPAGGSASVIRAGNHRGAGPAFDGVRGLSGAVVAAVTGADAASIQGGMPARNPGWTYGTLRSPGPVAGDPGRDWSLPAGGFMVAR